MNITPMPCAIDAIDITPAFIIYRILLSIEIIVFSISLILLFINVILNIKNKRKVIDRKNMILLIVLISIIIIYVITGWIYFALSPVTTFCG